MRFANGTELLAALPVYAGQDEPREWVVVVRSDGGAWPVEWICARVESLDAQSWSLGWYYSAPAGAMAAAYERAGIYNLTEEQVKAEAGRNVISR